MEKLRKAITVKRLSIFLTVVYLLSLLPILYIARYNYAGADDYSIGETCRAAWVGTHSVLQVIWQAVLMAVEDYLHWMGYFVSIFLMSAHPGVFGEQYYALTAYIMVGMLSFSTSYLLHAILVKALGVDKYLCRCISMLTLLITVQCMVGRVEAFYWFCGAVNYMFLYSVSLFLFGALISAVYDKPGWRRTVDLIVASLCGILTGGGNYMTSLNVCIVLAAAVALLLYHHKGKEYRRLFLPMAFFLAAFIASIVAPGNNVRAEGASGMSAVKAVLISLYYCLDYAVSEWTTWAVLAGLLLLVPFLYQAVKQTRFSFPAPILVVAFSYGMVSALITPPLFAVGNIIAGRLQSLIFTMYLLTLVLDIGYCLGWLARHFGQIQKEERGTLSRSLLLFAGSAAAFWLFGSVMSVKADPYYYTATSAITDLANGSARKYGEAWEQRTALFHDDSIRDVVLDPLPAQPELLFYSDFTTDRDAWENKAAARYYNKDSVVVKER